MKKERIKDFYYHKAKKEDFPARSVYKLEEINKKHRVIRPGDTVLDIGCAPGSWSKYARSLVGASGKVVGVDILPVLPDIQKEITFFRKDLMTLTPADLAQVAPVFDCVISDAAPNTSGDRFTDQQRSLRICEKVVELSSAVLKQGGNLVFKVFQGPDLPVLFKKTSELFRACKTEKPQSSRKESFEVYVVGIGKR